MYYEDKISSRFLFIFGTVLDKQSKTSIIKEMKKTVLFLSLLAAGIFTGCEDDDDDITTTTPSNTCNSLLPNKVSAKFNGVQWCADSICFADLGTELTVFGQTFDGASIVMELDDTTVGQHVIGETENHIVFIDNLAGTWESTDDNPGQLTVVSHNSSTNQYKANFTVRLRNLLSGQLVSVTSGNIDVYYTE